LSSITAGFLYGSKHINIARSNHKNARTHMPIARGCALSRVPYSSASAVSAICTKANKRIYQCAIMSDEPVVLLDLWLTIHTLQVENKPLPLLSIESSSGSKEGGGDQQMSPELLNGAFSAKSTLCVQFKCHKEPYNTAFETYK
jgi:hypothetical protein